MKEWERIEKMSNETKEWLNKRIENYKEFEAPKDEDKIGKCFFCGGEALHINGGGDCWWANVNYEKGKHITVLYHNNECNGKDKCKESDEAREWSIWRGGECGENDIIGEEDHDRRTPYTASYCEDGE